VRNLWHWDPLPGETGEDTAGSEELLHDVVKCRVGELHSNSAIVTCSYEFQVSNKFDYRSKTCVKSLNM
jgi:hypothetical protein